MINDPIVDMSRMDKKALRTAYLVSGYLQKTLTDREKNELDHWINKSRQNLKIFEELTDPGKVERYAAIIQKMDKEGRENTHERMYGRNLLNHPAIRLAIAALIIIIGIVIIIFFIFF
jgi:hypothetical protein